MFPFDIELSGGAMKVVDTGFRECVRDARRRGIKLTLIRKGEGTIMCREVAPARKSAALKALRAQLKKSRPARPGEQTASALMRELRAGGRY
jgi:hypothetical protein